MIATGECSVLTLTKMTVSHYSPCSSDS
ncbi:hypothetical protein AGR8A_Lc10010 [Agrobacterium fabrum str. J-07]|nr:hypothetical protein AGR8A_Lc10010 [Agrobacterium fabrum str. J-07]